jgi:pimeloyl-ACP methyl ester carboxylesterase
MKLERWLSIAALVTTTACRSSDGTEDGGTDSETGSTSSDDGGDTDDGSTGTSGDTGSGGDTSGDTGTTDTQTTTGGGEIDPDAWNATIDWYPCSFQTGGGAQDAECADVQMPLDWTDLDGPTIDVFVKRAGAVDSGARQIWLLQGGPGGAGNGMEGFGGGLVGADPQLAVYIPDHRGTGRSDRVGCPVQEAAGSPGGLEILDSEWPDCIAALESTYGDYLKHFRTTYAAVDVGWLARELRGSQALHVFGGSYGTYWAHRYLQLFSEDADAVSMLGVAAPGFDFTKYDERFNDQAEAFLAVCQADATCNAKVGPDPIAHAYATLDLLEGGHCAAAGLGRPELTRYFAALLAYQYDRRVLIPATLYRLERCDPADVTALQTAASQLTNPFDGLLNDPLFSVSLGNHISLSEMWKQPAPTEAEAQAVVDGAIVSLGSTLRRTKIVDAWPLYTPDQYVDEFAETTTPMLMLEGELDPNSPPVQADIMETMFTDPLQRYVILPWGNHSMASPTNGGGDCAMSMLLAFIASPTDLIPDCRGQIRPVDFVTAGGAAPSFFGTADLWENP